MPSLSPSFSLKNSLVRKLTDVTADTEPWTVRNVWTQCSARRSWTACKRRSMRVNRWMLMRDKDRYGCLFFSLFFAFFELQMSPPSFGQNKTRAHIQHTLVAAAVVSFHSLFLFSRFFFLLSFFFILYLIESKHIRTYTTDLIEYTYTYIILNDSYILFLSNKKKILLFERCWKKTKD